MQRRIALAVFMLILLLLCMGPFGTIFAATEQMENPAPMVETINVPAGQVQTMPLPRNLAQAPASNNPDSVRRVDPSGQ